MHLPHGRSAAHGVIVSVRRHRRSAEDSKDSWKMTQVALLSYVESRAQAGVDVNTTVDLLRRYAFLERSCLRALAGWFLVVPAYETKLGLGQHVWEHAERVDA